MDPILAIGHDLLKIPYSVLPDNYIQYDYIYIYTVHIYIYTYMNPSNYTNRYGKIGPPNFAQIYSSAAFVGIMGVM